MNHWRQLRWRIVAANMVIVVVGVTLVLLMAQVVTLVIIPAGVQSGIDALINAADEAGRAAAAAELLAAFRRSVLTAVTVAAGGAIVAGLITSLLLGRQILAPLNDIVASSERIAAGRYDERVAIPSSDELAQLATSFNQMAEALADVEAQRVRLIGNVSHELRTPLTSMLGYLEGLMDGLFPKNDETFGAMHMEVIRLQRLVDDLQTLSRVEAGQIHLNMQVVTIQDVIQRVVNQLQPQINTACIQLEVGAESAAIHVLADADRTAQVLLNLVGNAIRHTPLNGCITINVSAGERMAEIAVSDTGDGIPAEALPYLFERFYRVDRARDRVRGGSGIGLTIARHLIWSMGGDIRVTSPGVGQGSTFAFTLPLAPGDI